MPLEAINVASAREKSIRHGHPSTLHLWWARRPLAACRAVLFASIVDDPSSQPEKFPTEEAQDAERQRLFRIIEELVKWENSNNERVLEAAREEIRKATGGNLPPVLDPFCGGGSIPLEAQRLGLEAHASDLNPVAVLITKALIEIPPKFAGRPPVNPEARKKLAHSGSWQGAQGLAEDVRFYGQWMRDEAGKRIGHLYPKVKLPKEQGGGEATVIAWLWARTVKCPNPACGAQMPLVSSLALSTKSGQLTWMEPSIDKRALSVGFGIRCGPGPIPPSPKAGRGAKFRCLLCGQVAEEKAIRQEFLEKRNGEQLIAIVADGPKGRVYLPALEDHVSTARSATPRWVPEEEMNVETPNLVSGRGYGITYWREIFTPRQLVALTTLSDLVSEARERVLADAVAAGMPDDGKRLSGGGKAATAYADSVAVYLGLAVSKLADASTSLVRWKPSMNQAIATFARQALPMVWDFAESNTFNGAAGDYSTTINTIARTLAGLPTRTPPVVQQLDAAAAEPRPPIVACTDPPYYDNIGYADLSDFFYIWLRRSLGSVFPDLFSTVLTPKREELVATPHRFGGDKAASQEFFEKGLGRAFQRIHEAQSRDYPMAVFYAFKQSESDDDGEGKHGSVASTGWETMLEALLAAGFGVQGTWPVRSELSNRTVASGANALASSIVLACRPRSEDAALATRKEFLNALKDELPKPIRRLQQSSLAAADLAQAAIGPGMAVFSRYSKVVEADGSRLPVRTALTLINQVLDEILAEQESEFDRETRWALAWFEQQGMEEGQYGVAETLSKAKDTAVNALVESGILEARKGKVRLLRREELDDNWDPTTDRRLTVWEVTQHLIRRLQESGEASASDLRRQVGSLGEVARDLAYRLYTICDRKGWSPEAQPYNSLVIAWPEIVRLASSASPATAQSEMFR